jgi:hypothetical protein
MAVAVIQEFPIEADDRTTTNYDRVQEALGTRANPPDHGRRALARASVFAPERRQVAGSLACVTGGPQAGEK